MRFGHPQSLRYLARAVALVHLADPIIDRYGFPIGACGHVAEHKGVIGERLFWLELCQQFPVKTSNPGLIDRARVMRDQAGHTIVSADSPQEPGTIQRVEPRVSDAGPVSDVVQPSRCYQRAIVKPERLGEALRPASDALDMPPPARQFGKAMPGKRLRLSSRRHALRLCAALVSPTAEARNWVR